MTNLRIEFPLSYAEILKIIPGNTAIGSIESINAVNKVRKKYKLREVNISALVDTTMSELEKAIKAES